MRLVQKNHVKVSIKQMKKNELRGTQTAHIDREVIFIEAIYEGGERGRSLRKSVTEKGLSPILG